jgi:hypothetical protein
MDYETAQDWLDRYVDAWMSYDPDDVSGLFSEDVASRHPPMTSRSSVGTPSSHPGSERLHR